MCIRDRGDKAGDYLSIAISEFKPAEGAQAPASHVAPGSSFDMDDAAPAPRQQAPGARQPDPVRQQPAPARTAQPAARQPAPVRNVPARPVTGAAQAPAYAGFDDSDDIPFVHCDFDSDFTTRKARTMARYSR